MPDPEVELVEEVDDPSLRVMGKSNPNKIRLALLLESHIIGVNKLARMNLLEYNNRATFKYALMALEEVLSPYIDEDYKKGIAAIKDNKTDDPMVEAEKCMKFYGALNQLMYRSDLTPKVMKKYMTTE